MTHQTVQRCLDRAKRFDVMAALDDSPWVLGALVGAALFKYAALTSLSRAHRRAPQDSMAGKVCVDL